ncbi:hypothetical protein A9P82_07645 [Arachidicoccus ginsenosidimutans]|uniref:DUF4286 family protein n=1 Tax=Arachidicoccus sp. BS20 TaxID=1850526 RepID=UPI0007F16E89|nr:DUF4286 family protein [Arachidicoccus sp. BS20]ANI89174.1 hypothetical protein A9P82_07645 [Arachidicoccus sp. BS20]
MVSYNVFIKTEKEIENDFAQWFRKEHIPQIIATGCFEGFILSRQIEPIDNGNKVLVCRFFCKSFAEYQHYINDFSKKMRDDFPERFLNKYKISRTVEQR